MRAPVSKLSETVFGWARHSAAALTRAVRRGYPAREPWGERSDRDDLPLERGQAMSYRIISADCHIDMTWMPGDLWVKNAPAKFRDRVPQVRQTDDGPK